MQNVRKAVITAAGQGTRQFPATKSIQKELIPLVDTDGYAKPTLQLSLEDALLSGIEELCVIANPLNADPIRSHFHGLTDRQKSEQFRGKEWALPLSDMLERIGERLSVIVQETPGGYGHAVFQAKAWVGDEPFLLMVGDHISLSASSDRCPRQLIRVYERDGNSVSSVARIPAEKAIRYGVCAGDLLADDAGVLTYRIRSMQEKPTMEQARKSLVTQGLPADHYLCFYGLHVFTPAIFDCIGHLIRHDIRERGEIQLASAQRLLLDRGFYLAAELAGKQLDMGTPDGLVSTQLALALQSPYRSLVEAAFASQSGVAPLHPNAPQTADADAHAAPHP